MKPFNILCYSINKKLERLSNWTISYKHQYTVYNLTSQNTTHVATLTTNLEHTGL